MRLVKLNDEYTVMPDEVRSIQASWDRNSITVWMKDGTGHIVRAEYRELLSDVHTRLVNEINEAMK